VIRHPPPRPAPVSGFPAYRMTPVLDRYLPDVVVALQRDVERGRLHPDYLAELVTQWSWIREAGREWAERRAFVDETTKDPGTEIPAGSEEIDTARAADLLNVSRQRVRQLARNGHLPARQVGRTWLIDRASVQLRRETSDGYVR